MRSKTARRAPKPKGGGMSRRKGRGTTRRDDLDADLDRVSRMLERGNMSGGLQRLNLLIRDSPDSPRLYAHKASILAEMGKLEEAEECCRKALNLDGNSRYACAEMGLIMRRSGRPQEAMPYYDKAIKIYKQDGDNITLARLYSNKGAALADMERLDDALTCYRKSIEANPDYVTVHANMGALLFQMDRIDEAVEYFVAAKTLNPDFEIPFVKID